VQLLPHYAYYFGASEADNFLKLGARNGSHHGSSFNSAIADAAEAAGVEKLFAGEIVVTNPGSDSSQTHDYAHAVDRIFPREAARSRAGLLSMHSLFDRGSVD